jgi:hypothetical protein
VRRDPATVAIEQVVHHALAIVAHQVDDAERDADGLGRGASVDDIVLPRAIAQDVFLVDPVLHVRAFDRRPGAFEQQGGHGAVDAAGHGHEDAFHRGTPKRARSIPASRGEPGQIREGVGPETA